MAWRFSGGRGRRAMAAARANGASNGASVRLAGGAPPCRVLRATASAGLVPLPTSEGRSKGCSGGGDAEASQGEEESSKGAYEGEEESSYGAHAAVP